MRVSEAMVSGLQRPFDTLIRSDAMSAPLTPEELFAHLAELGVATTIAHHSAVFIVE